MTTLKVQKRNMDDKAKKLRREGFVTGSMYGKEYEGSVPLQIEKNEAERILHQCLKGSQLYLDLDGKQIDVLLKEIDYNAMNHEILEMDFQALVKGEKVHSTAEVVLHNRDDVMGGVLEELLTEVAYKAAPDKIVDRIDLECSTLKLGDTVKVGDLSIAKLEGVDITTPLDKLVVKVVPSHNNIPVEDSEEEK